MDLKGKVGQRVLLHKRQRRVTPRLSAPPSVSQLIGCLTPKAVQLSHNTIPHSGWPKNKTKIPQSSSSSFPPSLLHQPSRLLGRLRFDADKQRVRASGLSPTGMRVNSEYSPRLAGDPLGGLAAGNPMSPTQQPWTAMTGLPVRAWRVTAPATGIRNIRAQAAPCIPSSSRGRGNDGQRSWCLYGKPLRRLYTVLKCDAQLGGPLDRTHVWYDALQNSIPIIRSEVDLAGLFFFRGMWPLRRSSSPWAKDTTNNNPEGFQRSDRFTTTSAPEVSLGPCDTEDFAGPKVCCLPSMHHTTPLWQRHPFLDAPCRASKRRHRQPGTCLRYVNWPLVRVPAALATSLCSSEGNL